MEFGTEFFIIFAIILFFASLIQGSIGFGFPLIATPLLAMVIDMKTAVLLVAIPTLLNNLIVIFSEGNFVSAIKRFYPIAIFAMLGSAIGTQILIFSNSDIFKILLAFIILLYLFIQKFRFEMTWVRKKTKTSTVLFGLGAGIIGGLTNVMSIVLLVYSIESKHTRKEVVQVTNICFLFGKLIQVILFALHGSFTQGLLTISLGGIIVTILAMFIGLKLKNRIRQDSYNKIIKGFLFLIAIILLYQTMI